MPKPQYGEVRLHAYLNLSHDLLKPLLLIVEAYPNEAVDKTFVTGGVLCNKIYKLNRVRFLINPKFGRSGSTTDGKG